MIVVFPGDRDTTGLSLSGIPASYDIVYRPIEPTKEQKINALTKVSFKNNNTNLWGEQRKVN